MTDKFGRNTSNIRRLAVKAEIARVRKGDFVKSLKAEGPSSKTMKKMAKSSTAQRRVDAVHRTGWAGGPAGKPVKEHAGNRGSSQRRDARGRFA